MPNLRAYILPLTVAFALLMELIDATILTTAMPTIARALDVEVLALKLALTTYMICFAGFVPVSGWIADRYGARRTFLTAMVVFIGASALCAVQTNLHGLIAARAIQGLGAALMTPVGRLIVLRNTEKSDMVRAMVYLTVPALIGPALGPFIGAAVTEYLGWRWIFLINVPLGGIALALAMRHLPKDTPGHPAPFDVIGFFLSAIGLMSIMAGLSSLGEHVLPMPLAWALTVTGAGVLFVYWRRVRRRDDALLDPQLFQHRTFSVGIWGGLIFRLAIGGSALILPLFFQLGLGMSILMSGALTGVTAIGALIVRGFSANIVNRFGFRPVLIAGTLIRGLTLLGFVTVSTPSDWQILPLLLIGGIAQAVTFTAINAITFGDLNSVEMSRGTSMSSVGQQVSLTLGIALAGIAIEIGAALTQAAMSNSAIGLSAFTVGFCIIALTGPVSALIFMRLRPEDGAEMRGLRNRPPEARPHPGR
ncbi:hypothetical protein BFP70_02805 [Thioclava sp. SK-1]|uniref:MFS transporter n=1 Tax=Thioclava sp. SK-1 TaxID=1889770 RepID=UPI000825F3B5|nr:MFS transporter [Thioclava sp. SK-1]OCX67109.1 hypothetical protein BFP70_02805 [Thioclava sp. SK-1]